MPKACSFIMFLPWLLSCSALLAQDAQLKYGFKIGDEFSYSIRGEVDYGDTKKPFSGEIEYRVDELNRSEDFDGDSLIPEIQGQATSTAFAVSKDGFLLTCAHCVNGASEVQVSIDGQDVIAKIIELDVDRDLALLKVDRKNLNVIPLGKERKLLLAQDVRAIGYPLSTVLGESVKITRGSVAGFVETIDGQNIQIDVAVNPGNSGGPLIDETGTVVGVVNAKLEGTVIAKVGFAVPIDDAMNLLKKHGVDFVWSKFDQELRGPELAKRTVPSVFFVKAEFDGTSGASMSNHVIRSSGYFDRGDGRESVQGRFIIDPSGQILDMDDDTNMPLFMGAVAAVPFKKFPKSFTKSWTNADLITLQLPSGESRRPRRDPLDPFGLHRRHMEDVRRHFGGLGFGLDDRKSKPEYQFEKAIAERTNRYRITDRQSDVLKIMHEYQMRTLDDKTSYSRVRSEGDGEYVFDLKRKLLQSGKVKTDLLLVVGQDQTRIPGTLEFELEKADSDDASDRKISKLESSADVSTIDNPLPEKEISRFIENEGLPLSEKLSLLSRLAEMESSHERRDEIVDTMVTLCKSENRPLRMVALNTLMKWSPSDATPFLIDELNYATTFSKRSWIIKLGKTKTQQAATELVAHLDDSRLKNFAVRALIANGDNSAVPLVKFIENLDEKKTSDQLSRVNECLKVLRAIGRNEHSSMLKKALELNAELKQSDIEQTILELDARG